MEKFRVYVLLHGHVYYYCRLLVDNIVVADVRNTLYATTTTMYYDEPCIAMSLL